MWQRMALGIFSLFLGYGCKTVDSRLAATSQRYTTEESRDFFTRFVDTNFKLPDLFNTFGTDLEAQACFNMALYKFYTGRAPRLFEEDNPQFAADGFFVRLREEGMTGGRWYDTPIYQVARNSIQYDNAQYTITFQVFNERDQKWVTYPEFLVYELQSSVNPTLARNFKVILESGLFLDRNEALSLSEPSKSCVYDYTKYPGGIKQFYHEMMQILDSLKEEPTPFEIMSLFGYSRPFSHLGAFDVMDHKLFHFGLVFDEHQQGVTLRAPQFATERMQLGWGDLVQMGYREAGNELAGFADMFGQMGGAPAEGGEGAPQPEAPRFEQEETQNPEYLQPGQIDEVLSPERRKKTEQMFEQPPAKEKSASQTAEAPRSALSPEWVHGMSYMFLNAPNLSAFKQKLPKHEIAPVARLVYGDGEAFVNWLSKALENNQTVTIKSIERRN